MPDSRTYSLKKLAKLPFSYARKTRTGLFISCVLIALILTYISGDISFTTTQNQVLFLLFFAIGLWFTEAIPPFAVGILIVGFMVFIMSREDQVDAYKYVQTWSDGVIWLFLGGFFLAEGMKKTRLDMSVLKRVAPKFGTKTKYIALGFMMVTAILSMVMSNTATTGMMLATLAPLIKNKGETRVQQVFLLGIPASAAVGGMGTIIGSAPNAIAVGALENVGIKVSFIEWMAIGMPVSLLLTYLFWLLLVKKFDLKNETTNLEFLKTLDTEEKRSDDRAQKNIMIAILALTIFLWLTSQWTLIPVAAVSGIPIVGLTMLGVIDADDVRSLPWDTLMLVAGGLALGMAVQEQGLIDYFVEKISHYELNYFVLLVVFSFV
ncbi:MAG TPA: SLC13 family permease, partial [Flavobacteriaceae bacterium]|nr:SLC13 family permease [Flavobacteriaceae bacterium]